MQVSRRAARRRCSVRRRGARESFFIYTHARRTRIARRRVRYLCKQPPVKQLAQRAVNILYIYMNKKETARARPSWLTNNNARLMQTTRRENSNLSWAALANLWGDGAEALSPAIHLRWAQRFNFCIQKYAHDKCVPLAAAGQVNCAVIYV